MADYSPHHPGSEKMSVLFQAMSGDAEETMTNCRLLLLPDDERHRRITDWGMTLALQGYEQGKKKGVCDMCGGSGHIADDILCMKCEEEK